jgi:hypothetical protein
MRWNVRGTDDRLYTTGASGNLFGERFAFHGACFYYSFMKSFLCDVCHTRHLLMQGDGYISFFSRPFSLRLKYTSVFRLRSIILTLHKTRVVTFLVLVTYTENIIAPCNESATVSHPYALMSISRLHDRSRTAEFAD